MGTAAFTGNPGGGGGSPADGAGNGQAPDGSAAGAGDGGAGTGTPNAGGAGTLDRSKLNPLLRNMPEEQLNEVFDTLFTAVRRPQGQDLSGVPQHARPAAPAEPKQITKEELKEYFDPTSDKFDPQAAMKMVIDTNYGGIITDIGRNAAIGIKAELRRTLPDFDKYEADVDAVLAQEGGQLSQGRMVNTYFAVKGLRQTQAEIAERQKPPTTRQPSTQRQDTNDPAMSAEDIEVAKVMFRGSADPIAEYKKAANMMDNQHIRVPGDAPRKP